MYAKGCRLKTNRPIMWNTSFLNFDETDAQNTPLPFFVIPRSSMTVKIYPFFSKFRTDMVTTFYVELRDRAFVSLNEPNIDIVEFCLSSCNFVALWLKSQTKLDGATSSVMYSHGAQLVAVPDFKPQWNIAFSST